MSGARRGSGEASRTTCSARRSSASRTSGARPVQSSALRDHSRTSPSRTTATTLAPSTATSATKRGAPVPMTPHLPTAPANVATALAVDPQFWAEHETELRERFAAWLAAG